MNFRLYSLLLFCFLTISAFSQQLIDVSPQQYSTLKQNGQLTGRERIKGNAPPSSLKISPSFTPTTNATSCNCWEPRDATWSVAAITSGTPPDYRNDDGSTALINLPFTLCFYGTSTSQIYINNNGNITLNSPSPTYSASSFPNGNDVMIAPFWADVDTRGAGSGLVYYKITPTAMIVQWEDVGYYNSHFDLKNTFQLIITDGNDPLLPPGNNVSFCYKDMQWTTGDASNGVGGFGGVPATVGVNMGNNVDYIQIGLFDQAGNAYDGPFGSNDGVSMLDNQSFYFNACVSGNNLPPLLNSIQACDTLTVCEGDVLTFTADYLSPEAGQITTPSFNNFGMTGTNVVSSVAGNTASITIEITGLPSNLGYHPIQVSATDDGTPAQTTVTDIIIEVLPAPVANFNYNPASPIQVNTPVTFTNLSSPGTLVTWDFGDGSPTTTAPNPQHTYTSGGVFTVSLTAMLPNGCSSTVTQQITISACPTATFNVTNACAGSVSTITYAGTGTPGAVFNWDFGSATVVSGSGAGPYQLVWNSQGSYQVTLSVTEFGCTSPLEVMQVVVYDVPVASINASPTVCEGQNNTVIFNGSAGAGATYSWNFGNGTAVSGSGAGPFSIVWNAPGNDQIEVVVDENGCSDTMQLAVQINPIPTATFSIPATACADENVTVSYTGTGSPGAQYDWDFSGGVVASGSGAGPYSVSWNTGGTHNVTLVVTDNNCSSAAVVMPIAVTLVPSASISTSAAFLCEGSQNSISFNGTAGPAAGYSWNFGGGIVNSGTGPGPYNVTWPSQGITQVELVVTENGCSDTAVMQMEVFAIPTANFTLPADACPGDVITATYTGTAGPSATYSWNTGQATVISGSGAGPLSLQWSSSGNDQVSLTVSDNGCISSPVILPVNIRQLPAVDAGQDVLVCSGTPVLLGGTAQPGFTYSWSPSTGLSDPSIPNPSLNTINNQTTTQTEQYVLTVTDQFGCVNSDAVNVAVHPYPVVDFITPSAQCLDGNNFEFSAKSNIPSGVNFSWQFSGGTPASGNSQAMNVSYPAPGTYSVTLNADYSGCLAQPFNSTVEVLEMPVAQLKPMVTEGCEPLSVPFENLSTGNGNTYMWSYGDGNVSEDVVPTHTYTSYGNYSVTLSATNSYGCVTDTTYIDIINVFPMPEASYISTPDIVPAWAPIVTFRNMSTHAVDFFWDFGDSTTSELRNPEHLYGDTGTYIVMLIATTANQCIDTIHGVVRIAGEATFFIPNAFTPNGDGVNDVFRGYGSSFTEYELAIFNRWGDLIYKTNDYDKPWSGDVNGAVVQNEVYTYRIVITDMFGKEHTYVGSVTVLR